MPEVEPTLPPIALQIGHNQQKGVVALMMGGFVQQVNPPTARAYAIALIHAAEMAGLPALTPERQEELEKPDPLGR